jgi:hypothetical protein
MLINTNGGNGYTLPTNVRTPNVSQGTGFTGTSGTVQNNPYGDLLANALNVIIGRVPIPTQVTNGIAPSSNNMLREGLQETILPGTFMQGLLDYADSKSGNK